MSIRITTTSRRDANNNDESSVANVAVNVANVSLNDNKVTTSLGAGRVRLNTTPSANAPKYGAAAGGNKNQFGSDYNAKKAPTSGPEKTAPGRFAANKYTPTVNTQRPKSTGFTPSSKIGGGSSNPGRFQGIQKNESAAPSFGGSSTDRMAHFREAMEKEKAQKEKEEERKRKAEERKKQDEERKKQAELDKKAEEERKASEPAQEPEEEAEEKKKSEAPCKRKKKKVTQRTMSISNIVMDWVQEMTKDYEGVEIKNFSTSWSNGLAFCALIHKFNPDEFDFNELTAENRKHNFDLAFATGQKVRKIPLLLDTSDLLRMKKPEPRSVQTYVQWIWSVYGPESGYGPSIEEIQAATIQ